MLKKKRWPVKPKRGGKRKFIGRSASRAGEKRCFWQKKKAALEQKRNFLRKGKKGRPKKRSINCPIKGGKREAPGKKGVMVSAATNWGNPRIGNPDSVPKLGKNLDKNPTQKEGV